jgi:hypothetical protein
MKKLRSSSRVSSAKKVACTVSAAALMLGVSSAATIGLHFQDNYCGSAIYSGFPVTLTAFGVPPTSWENLTPMNTGYSSCSGPLGYNLSEVVDTTTTTGGLNPLPNGSLSLNWFGATANYDPFSGYGAPPPNYYNPGGHTGAGGEVTNPISGEEQVYATFIRDGVNFGPGSSSGNNDQPPYNIEITGLKSLFTNSSFVVELMASGDSIETLTNAMVIDVPNALTNLVSYPSTPPVSDIGDTAWIRGAGGGLSTVSAPLNTDHIEITSVQPGHGGTKPGGYNHAGTICGFVITDKPVITMTPQQVLSGIGDTVALSAYAIGVPPLSLQWRLNGKPIPGATNLSYTVASVNAANAGNYDLLVTNAYGSTTSKAVIVGDPIQQGNITNIVFDSNPVNPQHDGLNMGATWEASSSDGTVTRTGVMSFTAESTNGISVTDSSAFDGTNGTVTFWMRSAGTDPSAAGGTGAALFCRPTGAVGFDFVLLQTDGSPGNLFFLDPNNNSAPLTTQGVSDNKWHFVALSFDGSAAGSTFVYIDGQLGVSNANLGPYSFTIGQPLEIGYSSDPSWRDYNGLLDDVRYYNTNLTSNQISTIYTTGGIVNTNDLQLQFNFTSAPGSAISLSWQQSSAVLQSAPAITGPWKDLPGAASPYPIVPGAGQQFFRYRYTHTPQSLVSNPYLM